MNAHGQRWNLRKFASFSCQLQVNAARVSQFLDAETCFPEGEGGGGSTPGDIAVGPT